MKCEVLEVSIIHSSLDKAPFSNFAYISLFGEIYAVFEACNTLGETSFSKNNKDTKLNGFCDPRPVNREELIEICALKQ